MELARSCIQRVLKVVNSLIGFSGLAMIMYAFMMFNALPKDMAGPDDAPSLWFIYTTLGAGIAVCLIACIGHIAAETENDCCLYSYFVFIYILLLLEANLVTDVFLNEKWIEGFPKDLTGNLDEIKDFVEDNSELCARIGLLAVTVPAVSASLAVILKALKPGYSVLDGDYCPDRAPLLLNYVPRPSHVFGDPVCGSKNLEYLD